MRRAPTITIPVEERETLLRWSRGRSTPAKLVLRARIVLASAEGKENKAIAHELHTLAKVVGRWRTRYAQKGLAGIEKDAPRGARTGTVKGQPIEQEVVRKTTQTKPKHATHWSTRSMALEVGIGKESVRRIWERHGLRPHLVRTFKLSNDPEFAEKLEDIVGLYLNPPENAVVLCADEKSQIQALDRTQPGLPIKKGRAGTMTHDYKRNGTTTLFAAMCMLTGFVINTCMPKHRHQEWLKFLKMIDVVIPVGQEIHVIADNYATHKHPKVLRWLQRHPRFHMHFTPTSSSWLNLVERFFRELTEKRIRRDAFPSVESLVQAIEAYIEAHNDAPKPFVWTKKAPEILAKVMRARAAADKGPTA